jgi:tetratricopeptide (TPR) repeat protein
VLFRSQFPQAKDRALTYRALAWTMFNQKKYQAARQFLQQSAETQPDSPETLYLTGLTYLAENKTAAAVSLVQNRIRNQNESADVYAVGGELMAMADRPGLAEDYLKKAVSLNPQLVAAWQGLGVVLSAQSKYDEALEVFNKVVQTSPKPAIAYFYIAQLEDRRGNWKASQAAYQKSLELDPDNVIAKNNLAWSYSEHGGNIDVALRLAQEANQSRPDDPEVCDTLGWIYIKKNTPGAAIQSLKRSVALMPKNPEYQYHLGVAYLRAGDHAKARESLQAAVYLGPNATFTQDAKDMLSSLRN